VNNWPPDEPTDAHKEGLLGGGGVGTTGGNGRKRPLVKTRTHTHHKKEFPGADPKKETGGARGGVTGPTRKKGELRKKKKNTKEREGPTKIGGTSYSGSINKTKTRNGKG